MKIIKEQTACDVCGELFMGEFIQHDSLMDDFDWEREMQVWTGEEIIYPHTHEQPTVECHVYPKCRVECSQKAKVKT